MELFVNINNKYSVTVTDKTVLNNKYLQLPKMDQKTFENVKNLHLNWYVYAVKALIAQMAKHLYTKINSGLIHLFF